MTSFQGPGTGISGTSNQFAVGYAQSSGYTNSYANYAGNVNGNAPQGGYANQGAATAANIQSSNGINGTNWAWSGQNGTPSWLWGSNDGNYMAVWGPNQMYVGSVGYANQSTQTTNQVGYAPMAGYTQNLRFNGFRFTYTMNFGWAGQDSVNNPPLQFLGSNDGNYSGYSRRDNMYVGSVGYANYVGSAGNSSYAQSYAYTNTAAYLNNSANNIGGSIQGGWRSSGSQVIVSTQNVDGAFFNGKLNQGVAGDRFRIYYVPEQNTSQYGAFNGNWYSTSDVRIKDEIEDLDEKACIKFITQLKPRKFRWKSDKISDDMDIHDRVGFIAQEVLSAASTSDDCFIHIVNNGDKYLEGGGCLDTENFDYEASNNLPTLGVSMEQFTSPLVKTVQSIIDDVDSLKSRITTLKQKFNIE